MPRKKSTKTKTPADRVLETPPRKRQRVDSRCEHSDINGSGSSSLSTLNGNDAGMSAAYGGSVPAPAYSIGPPLSSPERMRYSLQALNNETHATCNEVLAAEQDDKSTGGSYARALNRYKLWWLADQARAVSQDPMRKEIPALPITAAKAAAFLSYESTRPKRKQGSNTEILGTRVGSSQISQVINGLEYHRHHRQHEYPDDPDAQRGLRSDKRIRAFESASKHNEPKRADNAQVLKAAGTSSDTYTPDELARCASWCLTHFSGPKHTFLGLRDRSQMLVGSATAFRGESSRQLLWSDLFMKMVPMPDLGPDVHVPALVALADNGKTNQSGRVDEFGAFRHRRVELCAVGSLATLFFAYFHIVGMPVPDFKPDFTANGFGEYGRRAWYNYHVFSTTTPENEMSYDAHRNRVLKIHMANQVSITKVTHATRPYAAQTCRSNGATSDGTKALGGWSENGSYRQCYDRALPVDAILGAAMFNACKPETYCLPRDYLEPSTELLSSIFPWIEAAESARIEHEETNVKNRDIALRQFLLLLTWLRTVLLQDAAILFTANPHSSIFKYAPFNSPAFHTFASTATATIAAAEEKTRLALHNLPQQMVQTLEGVLTGHALQMQQLQHAHRAELLIMREEVVEMKGVVKLLAGSKRSRNTRPRAPLSLAVAPALPAPPITQISAVAAAVNVVPAPFWTTASPGVADSPPPPTSPSPFCTTLQPLPQPQSPPHTQTSFLTSVTTGPRPPPQPQSPPRFQTSLPTTVSDPDVKWATLVQRFGETQLRLHFPEWINGEWLPHYKYKALPAITDIWTEWAVGWEGCIPVRVLEEVWDARWRRNVHSQRTEHGRRKKVIGVIMELSQKPKWSVQLVLRFIAEKYEPRYKPRAFVDYLMKNRASVIVAAASYP